MKELCVNVYFYFTKFIGDEEIKKAGRHESHRVEEAHASSFCSLHACQPCLQMR